MESFTAGSLVYMSRRPGTRCCSILNVSSTNVRVLTACCWAPVFTRTHASLHRAKPDIWCRMNPSQVNESGRFRPSQLRSFTAVSIPCRGTLSHLPRAIEQLACCFIVGQVLPEWDGEREEQRAGCRQSEAALLHHLPRVLCCCKQSRSLCPITPGNYRAINHQRKRVLTQIWSSGLWHQPSECPVLGSAVKAPFNVTVVLVYLTLSFCFSLFGRNIMERYYQRSEWKTLSIMTPLLRSHWFSWRAPGTALFN